MNQIDLDIQTEKAAHPCPKCKNPETDRIPRSQVLKTFVPWLNLKHYICYKCGNKFYTRK